MITPDLSLDIAKDAARRINALGEWIAVSFDGKRRTLLGFEAIVGLAVFPRMAADSILREMNEIHTSWPPSSFIVVLFEGRMVNVTARSKSRLHEAQLIRSIVLDAASERAPVNDDAVPVGPAGRPQLESAWRAN